MTDLISLDSPDCLDAAVCGDKAARLALARAGGFPVLPGFVVPTAASREALAAAVGASDDNPYRARLAVMDCDVRGLAPVVTAARALASSVVVRSSSPVERDGRWAGAFTSYVGVEPESVLTAVRGVWASAVTVGAAPGDSAGPVPMAVLVQPEVRPRTSGTARVEADGTVTVIAVSGSPADLMTGWSRGASARVTPDARVDGDRALGIAGREVLTDVARMVRALREAVGDSLVEWAAVDDAVLLLQCRKDDQQRPATTLAAGLHVTPVHGMLSAGRYLYAYAGPLGEQLVLPWLLAGEASRTVVPKDGSAGTTAMAHVTATDANAAWARAQALAGELKAHVWGTLPNRPSEPLRQLRSRPPASVAAWLAGLPTVDVPTARRLLASCETVGGYLVRTGRLRRTRQLWLLTADEVTGLLDGTGQPPSHATLDRRERRSVLRSEPLVFAAVMTEGRRTSGEAAAPGSGAGLIRRADAATTSEPESARYVLVAHYPLARYAPLLWSASGLVACEGSTGAHLIEVARSLGVPAVVGCSTARPALLGTYDLAAVDGDTGIVAFASAAATYQPAPGDVEHQRPLPIGCL